MKHLSAILHEFSLLFFIFRAEINQNSKLDVKKRSRWNSIVDNNWRKEFYNFIRKKQNFLLINFIERTITSHLIPSKFNHKISPQAVNYFLINNIVGYNFLCSWPIVSCCLLYDLVWISEDNIEKCAVVETVFCIGQMYIFLYDCSNFYLGFLKNGLTNNLKFEKKNLVKHNFWDIFWKLRHIYI